MTIGIKDLVDQINSEIGSPANDSTRVAQLAGSTTFNTYSVATVDALPLASENTGRFILVLSSDSYYFSDGVKWTNKVESTVGSILTPWVWGLNSAGALGDGTSVNKSSPILFDYDNLGWCEISVGYTSIAIRGNGTAWAWGSGSCGRIGDTTTVNKSFPVAIVGGFADWYKVDGGLNPVALRSNGSIWSWGSNTSGELGDGTTVNKSSPVSVVGGFTDWCGISTSTTSVLGLRKNGTLWSWGNNLNGVLGDGTTVSKSSPVSVVGGFTDWCGISSGNSHSMAIRTNGTIWAWGCNGFGVLGDGTIVNKSSPVSVVGGFTDWCQVSAGSGHNAALRQNGSVWTWGRNNIGQLGDGTTVNQSSPVSITGGFTDWCRISTKVSTVAAIRTNGTAWAWGGNGNGTIGDGTVVNKSSPVSVLGGFTDWSDVRAGKQNTVMFRYTPKGF